MDYPKFIESNQKEESILKLCLLLPSFFASSAFLVFSTNFSVKSLSLPEKYHLR